ncbi:MAG TPA: hypothetical protein VF588_12090 [Pyrinomonadaceae bacterium]
MPRRDARERRPGGGASVGEDGRGGRVSFIGDVRGAPSARRFDQWGLWRPLVWTNPLFILLFRRRQSAWRGWYERAPR